MEQVPRGSFTGSMPATPAMDSIAAAAAAALAGPDFSKGEASGSAEARGADGTDAVSDTSGLTWLQKLSSMLEAAAGLNRGAMAGLDSGETGGGAAVRMFLQGKLMAAGEVREHPQAGSRRERNRLSFCSRHHC